MKGGSVPTFHILLCTAGKPEINAMVASLKNELLEGDAITIIFDGPTAYANSKIDENLLKEFKCSVNIIKEETVLGFWGHTARNKYQGTLTPKTTFIMNADDDDTYIAGSFNILRQKCTDPSILYISKMTYTNDRNNIIPKPNDNEIRYSNISTQNGIIPFSLASKGIWKEKYGGDFDYYTDLKKTGVKIVFLDDIIYLKAPSKPQAGGYTTSLLKHDTPNAKIKVFMYASEMKPELEALLKSLIKHKYSYEVIGFGKPWTTFRARLEAYLDAANKHKNEVDDLKAVIVFIDAYDALCIKDCDKVYDSFINRPRKMKAVYGGETHCYENCHIDILNWYDKHNLLGGRKVLESSLKNIDKYKQVSDKPIFLNAGFVIGEVGNLSEVFSGILNNNYNIDENAINRYKTFYKLNHKVLYKNSNSNNYNSLNKIDLNKYKEDDQIITAIYASNNLDSIDIDIENNFVRVKIIDKHKSPDENGINGPGFLHYAGDKSSIKLLDLYKEYE
jgi:hypothetical protein